MMETFFALLRKKATVIPHLAMLCIAAHSSFLIKFSLW